MKLLVFVTAVACATLVGYLGTRLMLGAVFTVERLIARHNRKD